MKDNKILEYAPIEFINDDFICGIDEVGRGCGAGPVVTAAVILPKGFSSPLIRDSKKLTEKQRNEAYNLIMENAISIVCEAGSVKEIDDLGINQATFNTMHKCLDKIDFPINLVLVDGTVWVEHNKYKNIKLVPKGDDTYLSIAAAAIIAKVRRDEYMVKLNELHPEYDWASNKGYLSPKHITALKEFGKNRYHRNLFVKNFVK